jgi:hypothetical protein
MAAISTSHQSLPLQSSKLILVALPDDGTDRRLLEALRRDKGVTRADTVSVRAVAALQDAAAQRGKLPEATLGRLVTVVSSEQEADALFDYIYRVAAIDRPGGGIVMMHRLSGATPFLLPEGLPDEK